MGYSRCLVSGGLCLNGWIAISQFLTGRWFLADAATFIMLCGTRCTALHVLAPVLLNHFAYHFTPLLVLLSPITC